MSQSVSAVLRRQVAERAGFRCEYCLVPERFLATVFHVDHVRSIKHGGTSMPDNLAYSCPHCNQNKGSNVATFLDEEGEETVRVFNPRRDNWASHFEQETGMILPITPIGKATIGLLEMNAPDRLIFRRALAEAGYYP
ncbi:MAG: HNH endonuclease [Lewinellaceae bacterium]|nr:HNH endonuclease [Lewinellaceae bacterium]